MDLIEKSWASVFRRALKSAWRNVWPKIVQEGVFECCVEEPGPSFGPVVNDSDTITESLDVQVDSSNAGELWKNTQEASAEELQQLSAEQQRMAAKELSKEEREYQGSV